MKIETIPQLDETYKAARRAMIESCNKAGMTQAETARKLNISRTWLNQLIKRYDIRWRVIRQGWPKHDG